MEEIATRLAQPTWKPLFGFDGVSQERQWRGHFARRSELVAIDADWRLLAALKDVCHSRRQLSAGVVGGHPNGILAARTGCCTAGCLSLELHANGAAYLTQVECRVDDKSYE